MPSVKRRLQGLLVFLVFMIMYYAFLLDFTLSVKNSIVNTLEANNLTTITVPLKEYNGTAWVDKPMVFNLTGFVDIALTLAIIFAPIVVAFRYFIG